MKEAVLEEMRHAFRPEFLNRVDEIIVFHSLSEDHLNQIVKIQLERLRSRLADRRVRLELTDRARTHLVRSGYDPAYGARVEASDSKADRDPARQVDDQRRNS